MLENQLLHKSSTVNENNKFSQQSQEEVGSIYIDAQKALMDFETEELVVSDEEVSFADPRIEKYLLNARILFQHKEYSLALNLLRQASNLDSKNPHTLKLLGNTLEKSGKISEALLVKKAALKYDYCFETLYNFATTLYKLGHDQESLDKYYEALSVLTIENDELFEVYKNMGNIFVRRGDFDGAEEYYNKAYTLNTRSDVLLVNFGTLEVQRSDFDKSLYCFRKAIEINPRNDKAWVGLAMVHNQFTDLELAWANIESALDINPANRTAVHLMANWAVRDHRSMQAIPHLQNYLGCVEQDEDMSLVLINLLCATNQFTLASLEIERVLLWNPDNTEVRLLKKKLSSTLRAV